MTYDDDPPYEELALDQAHAYLNRTPRPYSDEAMRWMVRGLLKAIDTQRSGMVASGPEKAQERTEGMGYTPRRV